MRPLLSDDEYRFSVSHVFAIPRLEEGSAMQLRVKFALATAPLIIPALMILVAAGPACAASITIVALGASNTYGKGVARNQAYPAQLEAMLHASGSDVRVVNAGINGDTTGGMLSRLDGAVPAGTKVVILQPGGNDARKGQGNGAPNISAINSRLAARGIKVVMLPNQMLSGLPHQPDGMHLTPEGYRMLAAALLPQVKSAIGQ
jgi:acyl-CoA thioesterase I